MNVSRSPKPVHLELYRYLIRGDAGAYARGSLTQSFLDTPDTRRHDPSSKETTAGPGDQQEVPFAFAQEFPKEFRELFTAL
jgi:hypothetical protein